jgi:hypothetical protein
MPRQHVGEAVRRLTPPNKYNQHGKLVEDALVVAMAERKRKANSGEIGPDTQVIVLIERDMTWLEEDGRSPVTIATYRFAIGKLRPLIGGLRGLRGDARAHRRGVEIDAVCPRCDYGAPGEVDSARRVTTCRDGRCLDCQSGA